MKNLKLVLTLLFFGISFASFAQKIKLKKGDVFVDETVWMKYQDCGSFEKTCSLLDKNNEEVVFLNWVTVPGAEPMTSSNPQGNLVYVEVKF